MCAFTLMEGRKRIAIHNYTGRGAGTLSLARLARLRLWRIIDTQRLNIRGQIRKVRDAIKRLWRTDLGMTEWCTDGTHVVGEPAARRYITSCQC
jgi:hypothetical protein